MSNPLIVLQSKADRERAIAWVRNAKAGVRVEFKDARRTLPQNDKLHAMLTVLCRKRRVHHGAKMNLDRWKLVFLQAYDKELEVLPTLDGDGWFPVGQRTRDLSVAEASEVITIIEAWAAGEGIDLHDPADAEAA